MSRLATCFLILLFLNTGAGNELFSYTQRGTPLPTAPQRRRDDPEERGAWLARQVEDRDTGRDSRMAMRMRLFDRQQRVRERALTLHRPARRTRPSGRRATDPRPLHLSQRHQGHGVPRLGTARTPTTSAFSICRRSAACAASPAPNRRRASSAATSPTRTSAAASSTTTRTG